MKNLILMLIVWVGIFNQLNAGATSQFSVQIDHQQAKDMYKALTGPAIQEEGAAGHTYRSGKNIVCKYTNADMDDNHHHPIPPKDNRRYFCNIKFNANGLVLPAPQG